MDVNTKKKERKFGVKIQIRFKFFALKIAIKLLSNEEKCKIIKGRLLPKSHQTIKELRSQNQKTNQFVSHKPFVMVSHNGCKLLRGKLWKTCKTAYFSRLMTPLKCFTMFHCCSSIYFTHCGKITIFVKKIQFSTQNLNFRAKNERKLS